MSTQSFPAAGPLDVVAKFGFGSIVVHNVDGLTEAEVNIDARDPDSDVLERTEVELRGGQLTINGPRPRSSLLELPVLGGSGGAGKDALDIVVRVPSDSRVKVACLSADVSVTGRTGNADIASGMSEIDLEEVAGDARIRFGSGPVRIGSVRGRASVRAGSSDVSVGEAGGDVDVRFGAGSLDITSSHGSVRMKTGAGTARIGKAAGDVDLTSGTGEIAIGIPSGQQARLDLMTGTGRLHTDMPVEPAPYGPGRVIRIKAMTGSGDVTITRAG
jgi:DUF4097 and DUF4098 domain-containing protein YvlB